MGNEFNGLPQALDLRHDLSGVPYRVNSGLGKQISFIAAERPRHPKQLYMIEVQTISDIKA
jgi:hypothetical protein